MEDETIEFSEFAVRAYLDQAIWYWRDKDLLGSPIAKFYLDAFQSMRVTLFGEELEDPRWNGDAA